MLEESSRHSHFQCSQKFSAASDLKVDYSHWEVSEDAGLGDDSVFRWAVAKLGSKVRFVQQQPVMNEDER
jgi:hypothetical protein